MAEGRDFNDVLDDIFLGEEREHKQSYEEGFKAGSEAGNPEGYHLGYHRGAELGRELGYYLGIVIYHININETSQTKLSEKVLSQLTKVKDLIENFPRENSEDHDILGMAEMIRAQYKKACALLKISSVNPYDADVQMLPSIKRLQLQLDAVTRYLTPLLPLANCHMVEFLTNDHWERLVPENLKRNLDEWDLNYAVGKFWEYAVGSDDTIELNTWIKEARSHYISVNNDHCLTTDQLQDRMTTWGGDIKPEIKVTEFMTSKKSYEVATMSRLVASLFSATNSTCCVEAGGGRGHLLVALSLGYKVPSLTVDCDENKVRAAAARIRLIQKQWNAITKRTQKCSENQTIFTATKNNTKQHNTFKDHQFYIDSKDYTDPSNVNLQNIDTILQHSYKNLHNTDLHLDSSGTNMDDIHICTESNLPHTVLNVHQSDIKPTKLHYPDLNLKNSDSNLHKSDIDLNSSNVNLSNSDIDFHQSNNNQSTSDTNWLRSDSKLQQSDTNLNRSKIDAIRSDSNLRQSETDKDQSDSSYCQSDINLTNSDKNTIHTDSTLHPVNVKNSNTNKETNLHRFATAYITRDTDLAGVVADKFPEYTEAVKLLLTGLHTCGDLGPASLRIFTSRASTAAVFNVPCCYHLLTEEADDSGFPMSNYLRGYTLGRNARMLAAQSIDRVVAEKQLPAKSLLYRALLQVLIKTHLPNETISEGRLKRLSKCNNFQEYFKMADAMLNLRLHDRLPQSCLTHINKDMDRQWRKLVLFYLLRLCLAQVVESVILLDRLIFLLENDFDKVYLVKLFDPVLSPRCHGIVAVR